nr:hypothetical protein [Deltaproteobacteria bacterium]
DFQIASPLHVTGVTFGIQEASANQSIELRLGTYAGTVGATTLDLAAITPLTTKTLNLATASTNETVETAIDALVPAGSNLIVEIFAADHNQTTTYFYAGARADGTETSPGYLMATNCAQPVPRAMKDIDATAGGLVLSVTGTHY